MKELDGGKVLVYRKASATFFTQSIINPFFNASNSKLENNIAFILTKQFFFSNPFILDVRYMCAKSKRGP